MDTETAAPPPASSANGRFPIVGVGASAGGIDAFQAFFSHLPPDPGMAFVVILHLPAERKSMLSEILRRASPIPVSEAINVMPLEPNRVYVPPPQATVTVADGRLGIELPKPG